MLQVNILLGEEEGCGVEKRAGEAGGGFGFHSVSQHWDKKKKNKTHCQSMKGSFPRDCLFSAYLHLLAGRCHGRTDAEGDVLQSVPSAQAYMEFIFFIFHSESHGYSVS